MAKLKEFLKNIYYHAAVMFERLFFKNLFFIYKPIYFLFKNVCEKKNIADIKNFIKPGMRVLDVGANIGFYSTLFAELVGPQGEVHAFEPDPDNFARLQQCASRFENIAANNKAVDEKSGRILLYKSADLNVDGRTYDTGEGRQTLSVEATAIDDYFSGGEKIDAFKIDIQGYEYFALRGMQKTIQRSDRVLMIAEFWPYGLVKAGTRPEDFIRLLEDMGFQINFEPNLKRSELFARQTDRHFYIDLVAIYNRR